MEINTLKDLISYLRKNKKYFHDKFGVTQMGVFGSFTRDEQTQSSDIDMVIEIENERKNLHNFLEMKRYLEKETERKIDLGFEHTIKAIVKEKIKKHIIYV